LKDKADKGEFAPPPIANMQQRRFARVLKHSFNEALVVQLAGEAAVPDNDSLAAFPYVASEVIDALSAPERLAAALQGLGQKRAQEQAARQSASSCEAR
jgi:hypothetical protein